MLRLDNLVRSTTAGRAHTGACPASSPPFLGQRASRWSRTTAHRKPSSTLRPPSFLSRVIEQSTRFPSLFRIGSSWANMELSLLIIVPLSHPSLASISPACAILSWSMRALCLFISAMDFNALLSAYRTILWRPSTVSEQERKGIYRCEW